MRSPYYEETIAMPQMAFANYVLPAPSKPLKRQPQHEWEFYIKEAATLIGERYYVLHNRIEKAFGEKDAAYVLAQVRSWYHEAEKAENPGRCFNGRFKQWRERGV